jgi:hypothetical protein
VIEAHTIKINLNQKHNADIIAKIFNKLKGFEAIRAMPSKGWKWFVFVLGLALTVFAPGLTVAGEHGDLTDLPRYLNNPVGPVWNMACRNNWYLQKGFPATASRVHYVLNFQPVLRAW